MISDLINREALKEAMWSLVINENDDIPVLNVIETINNAQAVDISGSEYFPYRTAYFNGVRDGRATAIPQGKWIDKEHGRYECSVCGHFPATQSGLPWLSSFCPECGAKMQKGGAE